MTQTYYCIGGPLDGRRYTISHGNSFRVPVAELSSRKPILEGQAFQTECVHYVKESIHTAAEVPFSFWIPEGQSMQQTLTKLLERYGETHSWDEEFGFKLSVKQEAKVAEWNTEQDKITVERQKKHKVDAFVAALLEQGIPYYGASGGSLSYTFTPTSLGTIVTVKHAGTDAELDVTDYENW